MMLTDESSPPRHLRTCRAHPENKRTRKNPSLLHSITARSPPSLIHSFQPSRRARRLGGLGPCPRCSWQGGWWGEEARGSPMPLWAERLGTTPAGGIQSTLPLSSGVMNGVNWSCTAVVGGAGNSRKERGISSVLCAVCRHLPSSNSVSNCRWRIQKTVPLITLSWSPRRFEPGCTQVLDRARSHDEDEDKQAVSPWWPWRMKSRSAGGGATPFSSSACYSPPHSHLVMVCIASARTAIAKMVPSCAAPLASDMYHTRDRLRAGS